MFVNVLKYVFFCYQQCNNPMTKEAKLSAAMRIVPEWSHYDDEVKALQARVRRGLYQAADHEQVHQHNYIHCYVLSYDNHFSNPQV